MTYGFSVHHRVPTIGIFCTVLLLSALRVFMTGCELMRSFLRIWVAKPFLWQASLTTLLCRGWRLSGKPATWSLWWWRWSGEHRIIFFCVVDLHYTCLYFFFILFSLYVYVCTFWITEGILYFEVIFGILRKFDQLYTWLYTFIPFIWDIASICCFSPLSYFFPFILIGNHKRGSKSLISELHSRWSNGHLPPLIYQEKSGLNVTWSLNRGKIL